MDLMFLAILTAILISAQPASASDLFSIEEAFHIRVDVPMAASADIESSMKAADRTCFADAGTTAQEALEATPVVFGGPEPELLIKPKLPLEPKSAWGCYCGAYACNMWMYSFKNGPVHKLWSTVGDSVRILDGKSLGLRRLLSFSGSAGHHEAELYGWNGREYMSLEKKSVSFGQGAEADKRAHAEMDGFLNEAIR